MAVVTGWLEISHVIGKVVRGSDAGGLLRYLYGPGRANAHIDPHLVAGFGDPAELEPECRLGGAPDLRRLAGLLAQPLAALERPGYEFTSTGVVYGVPDEF